VKIAHEDAPGAIGAKAAAAGDGAREEHQVSAWPLLLRVPDAQVGGRQGDVGKNAGIFNISGTPYTTRI
jgi:hypothetical protein